MSETFTVAFTTFFAVIGPLDVVAIFAGLTVTASLQDRRTMAFRGTIVSTIILLTFAFLGEFLLSSLGISLPALKIAGGILLLLIGIEMVFGRTSGSTSTTDEEELEAASKKDISVFPLATPLIAGPGAIGASILLMADTGGAVIQQVQVIVAMLLVLGLTLALLLLANRIQAIFGITSMHVISRVFGILLAALAVQFMIDGLLQVGFF